MVVKVLRPGIKNVIDEDLGLLYALAHLADKHWSEGRRLRPVEIVDEYHKTIYDEMDLMREHLNPQRKVVQWHLGWQKWVQTCASLRILKMISCR